MYESSKDFQCISDNSEDFDPYDNYMEPMFKDNNLIQPEELAEYTYNLQLNHTLKLSTQKKFTNKNTGSIYKLELILDTIYIELTKSDSLELIGRFASTCDLFHHIFRKKKEFIMNSMIKFRVLPEYFINKFANISTMHSKSKIWYYWVNPNKIGQTFFVNDILKSPECYASTRCILMAKCSPNFHLDAETRVFVLMPIEYNNQNRDLFLHFLPQQIKKNMKPKLKFSKYNSATQGGYNYDELAKKFLLEARDNMKKKKLI